MNEISAYPLSWPVRWPRTPRHQIARNPFGRNVSQGRHSMNRATEEVRHQLAMLKVSSAGLYISTNIRLRQDGLPYSNQAQPDDRGVAAEVRDAIEAAQVGEGGASK